MRIPLTRKPSSDQGSACPVARPDTHPAVCMSLVKPYASNTGFGASDTRASPSVPEAEEGAAVGACHLIAPLALVDGHVAGRALLRRPLQDPNQQSLKCRRTGFGGMRNLRGPRDSLNEALHILAISRCRALTPAHLK